MKTYSIGQIINYTKNLLVNDYFLRSVYITGEVSNCKYTSVGHIYFSLKDEVGSMPVVMFKGSTYQGLKFKLCDGQAIIAKCSIGMYEKDGKVQLYATDIRLAEDTEGRLNAEFLKLKEKLYNEGLFDFEHKKKRVKYPKTVGIVTAATGAAIQDIINIAKRRNPYVQLILYPSKVQGEGAAETIAKGIEVLDNMNLDTIIVGRGGGSIEDLWAFNEEIVARAIYNAKTPIISGTGHEVDTTIADYVADVRVPTPSAAAEIAIPDIMTSLNNAARLRSIIDNDFFNKLNSYKSRAELLREKIERKSPKEELSAKKMRLSDYREKIDKLMLDKYDELKLFQKESERRLHTGMRDLYTEKRHRLQLDITKLNGLSPTAKLINGFGYITFNDEPVKDVTSVSKGDEVDITLKSGIITAEVKKITKHNKL